MKLIRFGEVGKEKQDSLINYKKINLTYTNQIVATTL